MHSNLSNQIVAERVRTLAARVVDLRSEFEAQLRALARVEGLLEKPRARDDQWARAMMEALRQELTGMCTSNKNIRGVLEELTKDARRSIEPAV
jgi:hypothetical protein